MTRKAFTVGQVNKYIKSMFAGDALLSSIFVSGEVSNVKYHSSGHIYFSLKDSTGTLSCIMFSGMRRGLNFRMKDGDKVVAGGYIDIYERDGRYQLYAREIKLEGSGNLYEDYLKLKAKLEEMGMFDPSYKLPIPAFARKVGVVTAPTGAAIRDIQTISHRRNPYVQLILYPALVQGEGAKESIARGIRALDEYGVDVIIVGRGGGSLEDLWAFNEEVVAQAIFECRTPVISAVGHETDVTISDFVADLRAPTPSAAAELAVFDHRKIKNQITVYSEALEHGLARRVLTARSSARWYGARLEALSPVRKLNDERRREADLTQRLQDLMEAKIETARLNSDTCKERLKTAAEDILRARRHRFELLIERMKGLNPLDQLKRGFSFVADEESHAVTKTGQVALGDALTIHVTDGTIDARVTGVKPRNYNLGGS